MRSSTKPEPTLGGDEWMQDIEHMKKSLMMVLDKDVSRLRPMSAPPKKAYKKKKRSSSAKFKNEGARTRLESDIEYRHELVRLGIPISNLLDYCVGKAEPTTATCQKDPRIEIIRLMHKRQDRLGLRESRRVLKTHIRKRRGNIKIVRDFVEDLECLITRQSKKLHSMCTRRGFSFSESEGLIMDRAATKSSKEEYDDIPSCDKIEVIKKRIDELKKFDKQLTENLSSVKVKSSNEVKSRNEGHSLTGRSLDDIETEEMQLREDLEDVVGRRTEVEMMMSTKLLKIQEQKKKLEEEIEEIHCEKKKLKLEGLEYQDVNKGLNIRIEEIQRKSNKDH